MDNKKIDNEFAMENSEKQEKILKNQVTVEVEGVSKKYDFGTSLYAISKDYEKKYKNDIILAVCNGRLCELSSIVKKNSKARFITTGDHVGMECYRRSVTFLMLKAFHKVTLGQNDAKVFVMHSVGKGYYCRVSGVEKVDEEFIQKISDEMVNLTRRDMLITKETISTANAVKKFKKYGMNDKVGLLRYRRSSTVSIYRLEGFEDYFYGYMAYSTGILRYFKLIPHDDGFVLQMPVEEAPKEVPEFIPRKKVSDALIEASDWAARLGVSTISQVNDKITDGSIGDIILTQEALQEKKIADIAADIAKRPDIKIIMIAGPSSSGKTTFSHRLSIQLRALGLRPHPIPVDNYFVNREDTPIDEDGNLDFESLEAVDLKFFNDHIKHLLSGDKVEMPEFNFILGKREYHGNYLKLEQNDVLVIEGIHCLNDAMSYSLPEYSKYKIYVSALTPLNADEHNRIATSDCRLLRRIVRDLGVRGTSARGTIEMWKRVRKGEEKNIFPYQDTADAVFNSAMIYELSVLKTYAEPALFSVPEDTEEYFEAKRLLKFLDYVLAIPREYVPVNSLLREFIGGSVFPA